MEVELAEGNDHILVTLQNLSEEESLIPVPDVLVALLLLLVRLLCFQLLAFCILFCNCRGDSLNASSRRRAFPFTFWNFLDLCKI
jgi:hypothetical protein